MSMAPFFGVPGKLKTIIDRLTSARATNLDNIDSTTMARLDADVSSRASAATWTNAKAAFLDASVSSRAAAADLLAPNAQVFTSGSGTWTRPAGVDMVWVTAIAGGGGGGGSSGASYAGGGGSSGEAVFRYPLEVSGNLSITVGAGGGGGSGSLQNGSAGSDTTVGTLTLRGGLAGYYRRSLHMRAIYGSNLAEIDTDGIGFFSGKSYGACRGGAGGDSTFAAGTGHDGEDSVFFRGGKARSEDYANADEQLRGGGGGASFLGPGGAAGTTDSTGFENGGDADANTGAGGGGGSGGAASRAGGDGGSGFVLIEWFE